MQNTKLLISFPSTVAVITIGESPWETIVTKASKPNSSVASTVATAGFDEDQRIRTFVASTGCGITLKIS